MEKVDLTRYEVTGLLGNGADYEVRAAIDRETEQRVVLKRPVPQAISRQMHGPVEMRTDRTLEFYETIGSNVAQLSPIVGYTERANHDDFYRDSLGQEYRVLVVARAEGIPLVGDVRARIMRVPIGLGQNLFALFPLAHLKDPTPFAVQQQLLDLEENVFAAGYVLLDLNPQNVFYQPASKTITVIDSGDLLTPKGGGDRRNRRPRDIHDFYLEILKFYTIPQRPPSEASGYRDPHGMRPVITLEEELDQMAISFGKVSDPASKVALNIIAKVRGRAYADFGDFRQDLTAYLEEVRERDRHMPELTEAAKAWSEAVDLLREDHWHRYIFNPEADLATLKSFS
jgi:hypothetical protein